MSAKGVVASPIIKSFEKLIKFGIKKTPLNLLTRSVFFSKSLTCGDVFFKVFVNVVGSSVCK